MRTRNPCSTANCWIISQMTVVFPVPGGPRIKEISGHESPVKTAFLWVSTPFLSKAFILDLRFNPGFNKLVPVSD